MWRVLAEHIAGSRTAVIPNAGHWMFEQAPLEYGEAVTAFSGGVARVRSAPPLISPRAGRRVGGASARTVS